LPAEERNAIEKREQGARKQYWGQLKTATDPDSELGLAMKAGEQKAKELEESIRKMKGKTELEIESLFSYFKIKAKCCENRRDVFKFFHIWIVSQVGFKNIINPNSEDEFINGYVDTFCSLFVINNDKKETILPPKIALKRFFWQVYKWSFNIYEEIKNEGYMFKEDNH